MKNLTKKINVSAQQINCLKKGGSEMKGRGYIFWSLITILIVGGLLTFKSEALGQLKAAIWEHGNIVEVENKANVILRRGWGTTIRQDFSTNWFHIPITTPVILDDIRPKLIKVFVFYKAAGGTKVTNIHVYDGPKKVKSFDGLSLSGDHSTAIDASNMWVINPPITIKYGLGISIGVSFGDKGEILFTTAGADFKKP